MLKRMAALSIGVGLSLTSSAGAQEHNRPAMNALGRFFGIGWNNGYHSGAYDGRFQHEKDQHPASMYGSSALLYPYQPGYEPSRPYMQSNQGYSMPEYSNVGDYQSFGSILPSPVVPAPRNLNAPTPAPAMPPKPVEPPPTWLRPFLKDGEIGTEELKQPKVDEAREQVDASEISPSDLQKSKPSSDKPTSKEAKPEASDDDDLLTLTPSVTPLQRYNEARRNQGSNR